MVAITTAILGAMVYRTASTALALAHAHDAGGLGPGVALLVLVAVAHWGTWQGPVAFAALT